MKPVAFKLKRAFLLSGFTLVAAAAALMESKPSGAASQNVQQFNIESLPLVSALLKFARQADVSLVLPPLSYRDGKSGAVSGALTNEDALVQLLRGSEYIFEALDSGAFRIFIEPRIPKPSVEKIEVILPSPPHIEEILVSSTRRLDRLQKLPYSISVIAGSGLEDNAVSTTNSVARHLPSFSATNLGRGRNKLIVRGLSDGAFSGSTQSLVSTYFDFNRLTYNAPEPDLRLIDIEQIEVLRGPHGTLYGSGALGGLYRIVPRKPDLDQSELSAAGSLKTTRGGAPSSGIEGVWNVPVVHGAAALRFAGYYDKAGGYIDDGRLGLSDTNDIITYGGRGSFAAKLSDIWRLTVSGIYQRHDTKDTSYYNGDLAPFERENFLLEPRSDEFIQLSARIDAKFSWADFMTSTSWLSRDLDSTLDATLAVPVLAGLETVVSSPFIEDRHVETITNETHLASKSGGRIEWLLGFFWSQRDGSVETDIVYPGASAIPGLSLSDVLYAETLADKMTETAGFGQLTYFLNEKFSVTAGARLFSYNITANSVLDDVGVGPVTSGVGSQRRTGLTPKFVVSYHADKDTLYYIQGSEGYRVGGINLSGPTSIEEDEEEEPEEEEEEFELSSFNPDRTFNLEIGAKLTRNNGALVINGSFFHTWWDQIQSDQFSAAGLPIIGNVGNARNYGAEADLAYRISNNWCAGSLAPLKKYKPAGGVPLCLSSIQ